MKITIGVFFTNLVVAGRVIGRIVYIINGAFIFRYRNSFDVVQKLLQRLILIMLNDLLAYMSFGHTKDSLEVVLGLLQ